MLRKRRHGAFFLNKHSLQAYYMSGTLYAKNTAMKKMKYHNTKASNKKQNRYVACPVMVSAVSKIQWIWELKRRLRDYEHLLLSQRI